MTISEPLKVIALCEYATKTHSKQLADTYLYIMKHFLLLHYYVYMYTQSNIKKILDNIVQK